jgi:hypothetical protein
MKRTYHFVTPANFSFAICPAPSGPVFAESVRHSLGLTTPVPYQCLNEASVVQGFLQDVNQDCACQDPTPVLPPNRYTHQALNAFAICQGLGSPITSMPFGGPLPTGLRALSIGSYTAVAAGGYPGVECVSLYIGILGYPGVCPAPGPASPIHAVAGIGTVGGFPAQLFDATAGVAVTEFLDLENMLTLSNGLNPGIGSLFASNIVWNLNTL